MFQISEVQETPAVNGRRSFLTLRHILAGLACYAPTLLQPYWQHKQFKIAARCSLGVAVVFLWFGSMVLLPETLVGMALRGVFVCVFFVVAKATLVIRKRDTKEVWEHCATGGFPFCKENLDRNKSLFADDGVQLADGNGVLVTLLAKRTQDCNREATIEFATANCILVCDKAERTTHPDS